MVGVGLWGWGVGSGEWGSKTGATNTIQNWADGRDKPTNGNRATKATKLHGAKMETMNFGVFEQRLVPGRWSHGNQLFTFRARFCFAVSALALIFGAFLPLSTALHRLR